MKIIFSLIFLLTYLSCDDSFNKNVLIENFNKPIETTILQDSIQKQIDQYILEHPYYVYEEVPVEVKVEVPFVLDEDSFKNELCTFLYQEKLVWLYDFIITYRKSNGAIAIPASEVNELLDSLLIPYESISNTNKQILQDKANEIVLMIYKNVVEK
ncbi:MAG: hypothetical protein WC438_05820 [Candidatus Pacearchaeota archaeon]|jgi:hypothetical protein